MGGPSIAVRAARALEGAVAGARPGSRVDRLFRRVFATHAAVYRATGGRVGARAGGVPVCLLTTSGRRSGLPRTCVVQYVERGADLLVIASNSGRDRHPQWYLNLVADPLAQVQVGRTRRPVRARTTTGDERERSWAAAVAVAPVLEEHRRRTQREFPVVVLSPAPTAP